MGFPKECLSCSREPIWISNESVWISCCSFPDMKQENKFKWTKARRCESLMWPHLLLVQALCAKIAVHFMETSGPKRTKKKKYVFNSGKCLLRECFKLINIHSNHTAPPRSRHFLSSLLKAVPELLPTLQCRWRTQMKTRGDVVMKRSRDGLFHCSGSKQWDGFLCPRLEATPPPLFTHSSLLHPSISDLLRTSLCSFSTSSSLHLISSSSCRFGECDGANAS